MKILFVNLTRMVNETGGMAKVACNLANALTIRNHKIAIVHSDEKDGKFFFHLDSNILTFNVNQNQDGSYIGFPLWLKFFREFFRLFSSKIVHIITDNYRKKYLSINLQKIIDEFQPDIILSFDAAMSVVLTEETKYTAALITMNHGPEPIKRPNREIRALEKGAVLQVLTLSHKTIAEKTMPKVKTVVIGDAVPQYNAQADLYKKTNHKIIFVGAINRTRKRPHIVIKAFKKIAHKYPNWLIEFWGAAEHQSYMVQLKTMIKSYALEKQISLNGVTKEVSKVLQAADIFVCPSAEEGFCLALSEGLSMGLPAIGYKSCPGVNNLIINDFNGLLVDDGVEPYAQALDKLMSDKNLRIYMGQNAKKSMCQYTPEKILYAWENLFNRVLNDEFNF